MDGVASAVFRDTCHFIWLCKDCDFAFALFRIIYSLFTNFAGGKLHLHGWLVQQTVITVTAPLYI